jgi:hypothetical protein
MDFFIYNLALLSGITGKIFSNFNFNLKYIKNVKKYSLNHGIWTKRGESFKIKTNVNWFLKSNSCQPFKMCNHTKKWLM